jgi:PKD repeat protein
VKSAPYGSPTTFNASSSSSPVGTIASYAWNFGDGHTVKTTHPSITHTYATAGTFSVTLTVTNSQGTSTKKVFTGNTMSNNGGPSAKDTKHVTIAAG